MIIKLKGEVWRPLTNDLWRKDERFEISNLGRVISYKSDAQGKLAKGYNTGGYLMLSPKKKESKSNMPVYIHRAVASLFIPNEENKRFVIHKDYNKKNNNASNLQWATRKEVTEHNMNNPAVIESKLAKKDKPPYSKLTAEHVKLIKRKIFDPNRRTRMKRIAKQFGISEMQLYRIKSGENWGHITDF